MQYLKFVWVMIISVGLVSCTSIGPGKLSADRKSYNDIVRETDYQQLLTNIVRTAYIEPSLYLKVTSITSSYSLSSNVSATPSWTKVDGNNATNGSYWGLTKSLGITPSMTYSDSPTISYIPVDDATFVTTLHQPVSFDDIVLLFNGGINDIEVLARLAFNRVGDLDNASSATSPKIVEQPDYKKYFRFIHLLVALLENRMASIDAATVNGKPGLVVHFIGRGADTAQARELKQLLQVSPSSKDIIFMGRNTTIIKSQHSTLVPESFQSKFNNLVYVQTRSVNTMLGFLSHSVQLPDVDINRPFNWVPLMNGLMKICSSDSEPKNAFIKTYVNHHWFYISNNDINSKVTFTLLVRLMTLTAGYGHSFNPQSAPIITVPVGAAKVVS